MNGKWMDGWMDGWMDDGWIERWMDGWMDGWIEKWMDVWIEKLMEGSKERKTYLTDSAKFYLRQYLQTRLGEDNLQSRPLFVTSDSPHERLSVPGIQYMLRNLGNKTGVKGVHPHRFRRTIATDLLGRGMPIEQVKEFLGHEKLDTTMIYYTVKTESV